MAFAKGIVITPLLIVSDRSSPMVYKYNESVSSEALADLRESVGWNRMENEYGSPLMKSFSILLSMMTIGLSVI